MELSNCYLSTKQLQNRGSNCFICFDLALTFKGECLKKFYIRYEKKTLNQYERHLKKRLRTKQERLLDELTTNTLG